MVFVDDVVLIATGHTTQLLEETVNRALEAVASWMEENGLILVAHKTDAVILKTKREYDTPRFMMNRTMVVPKKQLKYFSMDLSRKLGFRNHVKRTAEKAGATADALSRIMPNVGRSGQRARKLLATVVNNQLLYAVPIWASALSFHNVLNKNILTT